MNVAELLRDLEWSGYRRGPGSGPMDSRGDGLMSRSCPECKGIDPSDPYRHEWVKQAWGHRPDCRIKLALEDKA